MSIQMDGAQSRQFGLRIALLRHRWTAFGWPFLDGRSQPVASLDRCQRVLVLLKAHYNLANSHQQEKTT
jgi:hypothetical protein